MAHPLAGKPAPQSMLVNVPRLVSAYYTTRPDPAEPGQRIAFGTSGHRGSSCKGTFNEDHILAVTQALCDYRREQGIDGPLFLGKDTHALSEPAFSSAVEVLAGNGVEVVVQDGGGYTPTPVISHAILTYNRSKGARRADGVVITPSHNPPEDGGFKYNPPDGGPADTGATRRIEDLANGHLMARNKDVRRMALAKAMRAKTTHRSDYIGPYANDLANVLDMDAVREARLSIGADPMGGSGLEYWDRIAERHGLSIDVVNRTVDPTFGFMSVDKDGKIRMDCSSPYAMARLIGLKDRYDIAFGNDPDYDRHGIVTRGAGLMNPNHYLSAAVWYLFGNRPGWRPDAAVGKTVVTTAMLDRIAAALGRRVEEVPVGFKWFVAGLVSGECGFGGEESAGASFLRKDGTVWTTDKDGIIMDLLAAEILARTGKDPARLYAELEERFGRPVYERMDAPASPAQKAAFKQLTPAQVKAGTLAGEKIEAIQTTAGNGAPFGGLKVSTANGWFAARPSGTEDVYKIYAESFKGTDHLRQLQDEAQAIVGAAFKEAGA